MDFVALQVGASCVVTDSNTVQEECSLLHVPAVACRDTTERPETVKCGSNVLCGVENPAHMRACVGAVIDRDTDWISPYTADRGVAARVVNYCSTASAPRRAPAPPRAHLTPGVIPRRPRPAGT